MKIINHPKISLGMITWMSGYGHLNETLNSLLNQSYKNFELTIYDDCSPEDPSKYILDIVNKDSRVKYVRGAKRLGAAKAFQNILQLIDSEADFFAWCPDHDIYHQDWLKELTNTLLLNKNAAVAYPLLAGINNDGKQNKRLPTTYDNSNMSTLMRIKSFAFLRAGAGNIAHGLFRLSMIQRVGGWPENQVLADVILILKLQKYGCICLKEKKLFYRRDKEENEIFDKNINKRQLQMIFPDGIPISRKILGYRALNLLHLIKHDLIPSIYKKDESFIYAISECFFLFLKQVFDIFSIIIRRVFYNRIIRSFISHLLSR